MGKQAKVRHLRRYLRWRVEVGAASPTAADSAYRRARGRQGLPAAPLVQIEDEASKFKVGMSVSGPPEAFGLPPDPGCAAHATGTSGCADCYPPRATVTVTAVDYETGTITLDSAP